MSATNPLIRSRPNVVSPSALGRLRSLLAGQSSEPASSSSRAKALTTLQEANPRNLPEVWFSSTFPRPELPRSSPGFEQNPPPGPDGTKVKLGKTLRILQERLPTLLQTPLPQDILSPNISLHLFPSTHPHLPVVSGRVAYVAALWTSPIAWNRVPIVGNVKLEILSERMVKERLRFAPKRQGAIPEQLVVRWRTIGKSTRWGLSFGSNGDAAEEFTGLFIFEFDNEGRVISHTIEHVQEGGGWETGVGAKFVGLTDWLLGGMKGPREGSDTPLPAAFQAHSQRGSR